MPKLAFSNNVQVHARTNDAPARNAEGNSAVNFMLLIVLVALLGFGLAVLYSVTLTNATYSFTRQLVGVGIGVAAMVALWVFDYRRLANIYIPLLVLSCLLIVMPYVPGLGVEMNGATSWVKLGPLPQFQPSEFSKPIIIVTLAAAISRYQGALDAGKDYLKMVGIILLPFILLVREDLGTGLVILIVGFVILFVGGAARRWLIVTLASGVILVAALLSLNGVVSNMTDGEVKLIKDYQMSRLLVFIDQDNPSYADDAYNLNQAKIAVGSGEVTGKGWGNATQSSGGFLPESATDFIFCVLAEEFGFFGSFMLIVLYLALLVVALSIGLRSSDLFGSLIVAGIMGMWLFQIVENIGMDLGLMPITGIPLPFMSYGSSFMITNFMCVGLLCSIWARRNDMSNMTRKAAKLNG